MKIKGESLMKLNHFFIIALTALGLHLSISPMMRTMTDNTKPMPDALAQAPLVTKAIPTTKVKASHHNLFYTGDPFVDATPDVFAHVPPISSNTPVGQASNMFDQIKAGKMNYQPANVSYQRLNSGGKRFNVGPGIGMPQTVYNTAPTIYNPDDMKYLLYHMLKDMKDSEQFTWLKSQEWYALTCLPVITCQNPACSKTINFDTIKDLEYKQINLMLQNMINTIGTPEDLGYITVTKCPYCGGKIKLTPQQYKELTPAKQKDLAVEFLQLGVAKQFAGTQQLPTCRVSIDLGTILQDGTTYIDYDKLKELAQFIANLINPLLFIHHYANPAMMPNLFEHESDIAWFANICAEVARACPNVTHICPISQPMGMIEKVSRGMQPPYRLTKGITKAQYSKNIVDAQVQASVEIKRVRPEVKVLLSHQFKQLIPAHYPVTYKYASEFLFTRAGDYVYNQGFIKAFKPYEQYFDGIALSVYPAAIVDTWGVHSNVNLSGMIDPHAALDAVVRTNSAFPDKDIYIVEAGCNSDNPSEKQQYVDMVLHVCDIASYMQIPVKTCFFWSLTDDMNFYREWNQRPGSTYFGFYRTIDPVTIKPEGRYLQQVISSVYPNR